MAELDAKSLEYEKRFPKLSAYEEIDAKLNAFNA